MKSNLSLVHVIIFVTDMQKMARFYSEIFSLTPDCLLENITIDTHWIILKGASINLALHKGREAESKSSSHKLAFYTSEFESEYQRLISLGVTIENPRSPCAGVVVADGRDPEGNSFSIESWS